MGAEDVQEQDIGLERRGRRQRRTRFLHWCLGGVCATVVLVLALLPQRSLQADSPDIPAGKRTFMVHCEMCHGPGGRGGAGPNLTDDITLYGGAYENILDVVANGVQGKPMNAWKTKLTPDVIRNVAAFVHSLKGTRPNSKPSRRVTLM